MYHLLHYGPSHLCSRQLHPCDCSGYKAMESSLPLPLMRRIQSVSKFASSAFKMHPQSSYYLSHSGPSPITFQLDYYDRHLTVSLLPHSPALHSAETLLKPKSDMSLPCSPAPSGLPAWPAFDGCQGSILVSGCLSHFQLSSHRLHLHACQAPSCTWTLSLPGMPFPQMSHGLYPLLLQVFVQMSPDIS